METLKQHQTTIIIGILLFGAGFVAAWLLAARGFILPRTISDSAERSSSEESMEKENRGTMAKENITPSLMSQTSEGSMIKAGSQTAGEIVTIATAILDRDGWLVIHEDVNGKPGGILGAGRLNAGTYTNSTVDLLRATQEGKIYYAMLHADDGDKVFDYKKDLPLGDASGNPIMASFSATK